MFSGDSVDPSVCVSTSTSTSTSTYVSTSLQLSPPCRPLKFPEIVLATENFDKSLVIGHGGFGKVYRGTIFNGLTHVVAAIKRLDSVSDQGEPEYWAEVEMLSNLRHIHLVSLIGYCNHGKEMILVYEYMTKGTLDDHLHKLRTPLSWLQRLQICLGAARGLDYLHTGTGIGSGIIHRDVKTSNILLNDRWAPKISDFGLSKISSTNHSSADVHTLVKGTFGYLDPDYFYTGVLTSKSDVYAFGVVLLEVLCRKRAVDTTLDDGLAKWAQDSIKEGNLKKIIDSDIRDEISPKCLKEFVAIAERCLHSRPKHRPSMADVVVKLDYLLTLQEKHMKLVHAAGTTIFRKMIHMFPFTTNAHGDSSLLKNRGNNKDAANTAKAYNDVFMDSRKVSEHLKIPDPSLKVYKFADLETATSNFSLYMLLGRGGFSKVFLGWVDEHTFAPSRPEVGFSVAVKRRRHVNYQELSEWLGEVSLLGSLAHPNIINLLGYCSEEHKYFLVYEYRQTQSFDDLLFTNAAEPLSWGTRLSIMIGVARGLTYLHSSSDQVLCCGVKSSDILLDQDLNPKLGDFGVAQFCPKIGETVVTSVAAGTFGYIDPHYYRTGQLSVKTDIYGFGVVLLETLTGLRAWDVNRPDEKHNLVYWASPILARREVNSIMDSRLKKDYPLEGAFECASLALRCLAKRPKDRPSSEEVLHTLEQIYMPSTSNYG